MLTRGGAVFADVDAESGASDKVVVVVIDEAVAAPGKLTRQAVSPTETPAALAVTMTLCDPAGTLLRSTVARQSAVAESYAREPVLPPSMLNDALSTPTALAATDRLEPVTISSVSGDTIVMLGAAAATIGATAGAINVEHSITASRSSDRIGPLRDK